MQLAVISAEPLQEMEQLIHDTFEQVRVVASANAKRS